MFFQFQVLSQVSRSPVPRCHRTSQGCQSSDRARIFLKKRLCPRKTLCILESGPKVGSLIDAIRFEGEKYVRYRPRLHLKIGSTEPPTESIKTSIRQSAYHRSRSQCPEACGGTLSGWTPSAPLSDFGSPQEPEIDLKSLFLLEGILGERNLSKEMTN